jgi:hypothetical protein
LFWLPAPFDAAALVRYHYNQKNEWIPGRAQVLRRAKESGG